MDIRIGNDVQIEARIPNLNTYGIDNIKSIECIVRHTDDCCPDLEFHCPSECTIHGCGDSPYNVLPHQHKVLCASATPFVFHNDYLFVHNHAFSHNHCSVSEIPLGGEGCCEKTNRIFLAQTVDPETGTITAVFPAHKLLWCGDYSYKIVMTLKEDGYGMAGLHTYTFDFGKVLSLCDSDTAQSGNITKTLSVSEGVTPNTSGDSGGSGSGTGGSTGPSTSGLTEEEREKFESIEYGANKYVHPTYTAKQSGLYKITVNNEGHVTGATAVTKSDITSLGIPSGAITYPLASANTDGLMSKSDKSSLDTLKTTVAELQRQEGLGLEKLTQVLYDLKKTAHTLDANVLYVITNG